MRRGFIREGAALPKILVLEGETLQYSFTF